MFAIILLAAASDAWGFAAIVLDPTNLIQNTISALKAVESVINEVQMIANQVRQIENMVQNTHSYGGGVWDREALPRLVRLGQIIDQEQAIAYAMAGMDRVFRERYPGYRPATDWAKTYDQWTRTTLAPHETHRSFLTARKKALNCPRYSSASVFSVVSSVNCNTPSATRRT